MRRVLIFASALVLGVAIAVQATYSFREEHFQRPAHLATSIPRSLEGWIVSEETLGPSEAAAKNVWDELRYDEYVFRSYRKGSVEFMSYVTYWSRGKMPARLVASHTPDRCFTLNGMTCLQMRFRFPLASVGGPMLAAEWRQFRDQRAGEVYVLYWHLVNKTLYDYGSMFNAVPNPVSWIKDALTQARAGAGEQYFFRLTSNVPFEVLQREPGFRIVLEAMGKLGS